MKNTNEIIRSLREDRDLTQKQIAELLGTSANYYGDYENGKREITLSRIIKLADYYDVSMDYLTGRISDKKGFYKISSAETELLNKFRSLDSESKGKLLERLDVLCEKQK